MLKCLLSIAYDVVLRQLVHVFSLRTFAMIFHATLLQIPTENNECRLKFYIRMKKKYTIDKRIMASVTANDVVYVWEKYKQCSVYLAYE